MEEITQSFEQTKQLGKSFSKRLKKGSVVALYGDLGSGKTTFTQGVGEGLGLTQRMVSPTFLIMKTYTLSEKKNDIEMVYHVDLYRLSSAKESEDIGLSEIMADSTCVVIIEWPEKIENMLPENTIKIHFSYVSENERKIRYE